MGNGTKTKRWRIGEEGVEVHVKMIMMFYEHVSAPNECNHCVPLACGNKIKNFKCNDRKLYFSEMFDGIREKRGDILMMRLKNYFVRKFQVINFHFVLFCFWARVSLYISG